MLVTPANLSFFFTNLETRFWLAYNAAPVVSDKISTLYTATSEQWVSGWIGMLNTLRLWDGPRVTHVPAPQTYTVPIQNFELTESIDQFKLEDDQSNIYGATIPFMALQMKKWPDYQIRDLLQNTGAQTGARQIGLDGLTHFNTAHPVNYYDSSYGTYSNDFQGGFVVDGVTVGGALAPNAFATVWQEMASRKSENGEALGVIPSDTLVPPQLKYTASTILQSQFFANPTVGNLTSQVGAADNMLKGWTDLMVWPDLAGSPNVWYMQCNTMAIRSISWVLRQAPNFTYRANPQDPVVFDTHSYLYGSVCRGTPAWGFSWLDAVSGPTP